MTKVTDLTTLSSLLELAEKATLGEWHQCIWPDGKTTRHIRTAHTTESDNSKSTAYIGIGDAQFQCDIDFIVAARNAMPALTALLTRVREAEEVVDAAILRPFELNKLSETPLAHELATEYRQKYPAPKET